MIGVDGKNSMMMGSEAAQALPLDLSSLEERGYRIFSIETMKVLYADPLIRFADLPLEHQDTGPMGYGLVVSGSRLRAKPGHPVRMPIGPVMRDGRLENTGIPDAAYRAGIAILDDGSIVMGRGNGGTAKDIQDAFAPKGRKVRDYLGGGALLVEGSTSLTDTRMDGYLAIGAERGGIQSYAMQTGWHLVAGIKRGQAFMMLAEAKSGQDIREDLIAYRFGTVIHLASGDGAYYDDGEERMMGHNPVGLGITLRR